MSRDGPDAGAHHAMGGVGGAASPYSVLGVTPGASQEAILQAYRRLARSSHPDVRPDDPLAARRFGVLASAFEVLGDPVRRAAYDRGSVAATAGRPARGWGRSATGGVGQSGVGDRRSTDTHSGGVFLDASPRRSHEAPLRVGPVRVEGSSGQVAGSWPHALRLRQPADAFPSLLRYLVDGWWSE